VKNHSKLKQLCAMIMNYELKRLSLQNKL